MAYFPNGTSGACYEDQYCANCVHDRGDNGLCPVWLLHLEHNYTQCDKSVLGNTIKAILGTLIPETKDRLGAEQCSMFLAKADVEAELVEQRRLAEQPAKYEAALVAMRRRKAA